jgi:hypothetical protein
MSIEEDRAKQDAVPLVVRALTYGEAMAEAGASIARIEMDCSKTWPRCPRTDQILCDCRLRGVRVVNTLRDWVRSPQPPLT